MGGGDGKQHFGGTVTISGSAEVDGGQYPTYSHPGSAYILKTPDLRHRAVTSGLKLAEILATAACVRYDEPVSRDTYSQTKVPERCEDTWSEINCVLLC